MTTLLVIGYVWPEPNSSAAGSRMMQLLNAFKAWGWHIHFASPALYTSHMADLNDAGIHCQQITLNCASFDSYISELKPDVVMFDRFMMEEQFGWRVAQHCPNAMRILDTEDLFFVRNARHAAVKKGIPYLDAELHTDMMLREISAIYRCDLTLMISDAELTLLEQSFAVPSDLLHHVPFMLPPPSPATQSYSQRANFISIGNFRHPPNWDAVLQLKQHIWPSIRKQLPTAELHIYGAYPPPKATALHDEKSGFLVKGWAADAIDVVSRSRVCLAPLRFGAGIKGKLTEAMQCGTPSVTSSVGAEGMATGLPWPGFIADSHSEFIEKAVTLYQDQSLWHECQSRGEDILATHYDAERLAFELKGRIYTLLSSLDQMRRKNIVGAMLLHHRHRSTAFMSQWIAAKNR